jgi:hypothetical protein
MSEATRKGGGRANQKIASLPTGTNLIPEQATSGRGRLTAENGTNSDAQLVLIDNWSGNKVRKVSIRSHAAALLDLLSEGTYRVYFETEDGYFEFGKELKFTETPTEDSIEYVEHTITLNPVIGGNVTARRMSKEEFEEVTGVNF